LTTAAFDRTLAAMPVHDPDFERKLLYSVFEVASITGRPPGLIRRWIYRGQLGSVRIDDDMPFVPFDALVERLERLAWKRHRREVQRATEQAAERTTEQAAERAAEQPATEKRASDPTGAAAAGS
jgi:hypothetical protein